MFLKFIFIFFGLINAIKSSDLPPGIDTCRRSDPHAIKCLNDAIQKSFITLKFGIPSLNVPAIEPLKIDKIVVEDSGATSAFNLKSSFKNAEIHGLSTSKILRTVTKFTNKIHLKSEAFTEQLDFIGQYKMNGQILVLPITGEGFANVSMHQMTTRHELIGDYFTGPNGDKFVNVTEYKIKFKPKRVIFRYDNLFNGDQLLGRTMNTFMNDNWEAVFDGIIPGYEVKFGEKFRILANLLFHKVPFEKIFPE